MMGASWEGRFTDYEKISNTKIILLLFSWIPKKDKIINVNIQKKRVEVHDLLPFLNMMLMKK